MTYRIEHPYHGSWDVELNGEGIATVTDALALITELRSLGGDIGVAYRATTYRIVDESNGHVVTTTEDRDRDRYLAVCYVIAAAKAEARLFVKEFPGEDLEGDWDSEAWANSPLKAATSDMLGEDAWMMYHETLHAEVKRLRSTR